VKRRTYRRELKQTCGRWSWSGGRRRITLGGRAVGSDDSSEVGADEGNDSGGVELWRRGRMEECNLCEDSTM